MSTVAQNGMHTIVHTLAHKNKHVQINAGLIHK